MLAELRTLAVGLSLLLATTVSAQSIRLPWSGYAHDPQHTAVSPVASQPLNQILWQTPVDLNPQYSGSLLLIHYGSPLVTRSNTVIVPVKVDAADGFQVEARVATNGALKWTQTTDYRLPPHTWVPSYSPVLTPKNRLYFPGGGGSVFYRDSLDASGSVVATRLAFYGLANYNANTNSYLANVFINTPITSDRYGNIFFGFLLTNTTPVALTSGVARIDFNGNATWISAIAAATDSNMTKVAQNCAPALANDHKTLYVAVKGGSYSYLVALDSRTLAPITRIRLKDAKTPANDASLPDISTASPTVGPDGDVYFGVFENTPGGNHSRGWLLHFNSALTQTNVAGAFGWDITPSIVPATMVPSYHGASSYLLMTKYNNYAGAGDGVNKIAVLDPNDSMIDPISGIAVMKEILTIAGPTPDAGYTNSYPNAVREWCINTAAVDPFTRSVLVNNEDGKLYRWDLASNTLIQPVTLTAGIGEAYTPTIIGVDGIVFAINNATLFAVGQ